MLIYMCVCVCVSVCICMNSVPTCSVVESGCLPFTVVSHHVRSPFWLGFQCLCTLMLCVVCYVCVCYMCVCVYVTQFRSLLPSSGTPFQETSSYTNGRQGCVCVMSVCIIVCKPRRCACEGMRVVVCS